MAATLMLACSNDKSGGHDGDEGVETEVNGTQLDGNTTLYGLVTDTSGNPVPGVVVSDGYGCVTTDANGVYQMERYKKARFVHYSTPAGYAVNTSADNYPLFYSEIVHKNIADRHDFVLTPLPAPESDFTLVCIADPQCATTAEISRYVNETIPDVETTVDGYKAKGTPVYGITLGDIVFDTPDLWSNMKESMANRNLPIFQTIGNHDHLQTETSDDNAAANFETQFGPRNYSFNRGDVHIVSMDNVLYEGKKKYKGGKQLEWLRQDLSHVDKDKLVIFCAHIPFRGGTSVTDESHENYDACGLVRPHAVVAGAAELRGQDIRVIDDLVTVQNDGVFDVIPGHIQGGDVVAGAVIGVFDELQAGVFPLQPGKLRLQIPHHHIDLPNPVAV